MTKPPSETFSGGYAGSFRDLDGHVWEVAHNPGFILGDDGALTFAGPRERDIAASGTSGGLPRPNSTQAHRVGGRCAADGRTQGVVLTPVDEGRARHRPVVWVAPDPATTQLLDLAVTSQRPTVASSVSRTASAR